jgi:hypothetical protein
MNKTREKEAINAYLKLLQTKGASSSLLHKRSLFLDQLSERLGALILDGNEYRMVVEEVMEATPADDWHDCLTASREFYPFWVKDIKAIATLNLNSGFEVKPIDWKPDLVSLKTLTDSLETEKFDTSENWPLKAYAQALRHEGADQALVDTRVKLAKIILMRMRSAPEKNSMAYRTAVDLTLPLFNIKQNRRLFLVVVREFFHFWSGNPDAASMVLQDTSGNMLL